MTRAQPASKNDTLAAESWFSGLLKLRWLPWVALATAFLLHAAMFLLWPRAAPVGVDLNVYRAGAETVLHGLPLYAGPVTYQNLFTYPPFAALLFLPLVALPIEPLAALAILVQIGLLILATGLCLRLLGYRHDRSLRLISVLLASFLLWLEPVWLTITLGQINIVLMLLVLWDSSHQDSRWKGIGIGLASGIKLTPLIFIGYLLLTRRYRVAATALATFIGTVATGFLILPADAVKYWTGTFISASRIGDPASPSNQSLAGMFSRFAGVDSLPAWPWLTAAALIGSAGLALAVLAHRRDEVLLGVTLVGLTATVISPFSWDHHWVWFIPLIVFLLHIGRQPEMRLGRLPALTTYLLAFCWFTKLTPLGGRREPGKGLFQLDAWPWIEPITRNVFVWIFLSTLPLAALYLRRLGRSGAVAADVQHHRTATAPRPAPRQP